MNDFLKPYNFTRSLAPLPVCIILSVSNSECRLINQDIHIEITDQKKKRNENSAINSLAYLLKGKAGGSCVCINRLIPCRCVGMAVAAVAAMMPITATAIIIYRYNAFAMQNGYTRRRWIDREGERERVIV